MSLQKAQAEAADKTVADICGDMSDSPKIPFRTKKILKGHLSKVTAVHYCGDNRYLFTHINLNYQTLYLYITELEAISINIKVIHTRLLNFRHHDNFVM